jgi:hypothetical protein
VLSRTLFHEQAERSGDVLHRVQHAIFTGAAIQRLKLDYFNKNISAFVVHVRFLSRMAARIL